jgi:hypothetical protein
MVQKKGMDNPPSDLVGEFGITAQAMKLPPEIIERARRERQVILPSSFDPGTAELPNDLCICPFHVNGRLVSWWLIPIPGGPITTGENKSQ